MPTELNRIRELSGLQQEASVSLKGKESALKAWYNKYSKYTGGNGDPLPFGLIKAYTESGIISDGYEENELAKAEKALGKKEGDWEDQDWQKVYSMTPITQGMEKDLLTATGSKTVDEELLAKVYDVIEDMYPSYDQVLGKKESAVAEAPAAGLTTVQPEPVLNAVKETSVTSQVDEAIKKATAQLKSFSNFDGLKPYKPKKK